MASRNSEKLSLRPSNSCLLCYRVFETSPYKGVIQGQLIRYDNNDP